MADETGAPTPVETPQPAAEPVVEAPVVETPAEPVVEAPPAEPVETPAEPVVEAPVETPAEEAPAEPAVEPPAEEPAAEEPPAEPPAEEAVAPVYEDFKLPEGVQAAPEQMAAYHEVLGKYGLSQEAGQELIDLHANAIKETAQSITDQMVQRQNDVFTEMKNGWKEDFYSRHPNDHNTVLDNAKFSITSSLSTDKRKAFWGALALTGAGDHPDVVDGLAAIGKRLREGTAPPKGLPANTKDGLTPAQRRYGVRS